jgi:hypothetical protein
VNFIPSSNASQLGFVQNYNNREETGAFPDVNVQGNRIVFTGRLAPGNTAHFIVFAQSATNREHVITLRQRALCLEAVPVIEPWALVVLVLSLAAIAIARQRRLAPQLRSK